MSCKIIFTVGLQYNCYKVMVLTKEEVGAKQGSV